MREFLFYKLHHSALALAEDPKNELGFVSERNTLRFVRDNIRGMGYLNIPFGIEDYRNLKLINENTVKP